MTMVILLILLSLLISFSLFSNFAFTPPHFMTTSFTKVGQLKFW